MTVRTGNKRIPRGQPVRQPMLDEKVERAIDADRSEATPLLLQPEDVDQVIGAERPVRSQKSGKDVAPDRRQPGALGVADAVGLVQGIGGMSQAIALVGANRPTVAMFSLAAGRPGPFPRDRHHRCTTG